MKPQEEDEFLDGLASVAIELGIRESERDGYEKSYEVLMMLMTATVSGVISGYLTGYAVKGSMTEQKGSRILKNFNKILHKKLEQFNDIYHAGMAHPRDGVN